MATPPFSARIFEAFGPTREALGGPVLARLQALLEDPAASADKFIEVLPPEQLTALLLAISGEPPPAMLEVFRNEVLALQSLVDQKLLPLKTHPGFKAAAMGAFEFLRISGQPDSDEENLEPRRITGVATGPMLIGPNENLRPYLRVVLQPNPAGAGFEFLADAEDLSYLAGALLQNLAFMLEQRAPLASREIIRIGNPAQVAELIGQMEASLEKIKQVAPAFNIALPPAEA